MQTLKGSVVHSDARVSKYPTLPPSVVIKITSSPSALRADAISFIMYDLSAGCFDTSPYLSAHVSSVEKMQRVRRIPPTDYNYVRPEACGLNSQW